MDGYTLVDGIYVDNNVFTVEFACDYEKCKGACCYAEVEDVELDGGSVTFEEAMDINKYKRTLARFCDKSRSQNVLDRPIYSDGARWFVSLNDLGECVLLNMKKGSCACKLAHRLGQFPFPIPLACQLYPLNYHKTGGDRFITLLNTFEEMCECGYAKGEREHIRVYEFCKDAIVRGFGDAFYEHLEDTAKTWNSARG